MYNGMAAMERNTVAPQKLNIELPFYAAIPLMDIHPKEMKEGSQRDIYKLMIMAALFETGKNQVPINR